MQRVKSYLKFFIKINLIGAARRFLLFWGKAPVNKNEWEKRILLVHLGGLGDAVVMTSVMKHIKSFYRNEEIFFLVNRATGLDESAFCGTVRRVLTVRYRAFAVNPWYGLREINVLRKIGFSTVINFDPSTAEIVGKIIGAELGAQESYAYEGFRLQHEKPFDLNMKKNLDYVKRSVFPRYTHIISDPYASRDLSRRLPNYLEHYSAIYEYVTRSALRGRDISPWLCVSRRAQETMSDFLSRADIRANSYAVVALSTTTPHREWPAERFGEVASYLRGRDIPIVLVGAPRDVELRERFAKSYRGPFLDLIGKTSIPQVAALIEHCLFSLSNDTSFTHLAIALQKPSVTILGIGQFGMLSLYGYADINYWVYKKIDCLCDDWQCIHGVGKNDPAPCVAAVAVSDVIGATEQLLENVKRIDKKRLRFQIKIPEYENSPSA